MELFLPYFEYAPGYQFLHCLVNEANGGLSSVVDGFAVANYLKKNEKDVFKILTQTYVKFKDTDYIQNKANQYDSLRHLPYRQYYWVLVYLLLQMVYQKMFPYDDLFYLIS